MAIEVAKVELKSVQDSPASRRILADHSPPIRSQR